MFDTINFQGYEAKRNMIYYVYFLQAQTLSSPVDMYVPLKIIFVYQSKWLSLQSCERRSCSIQRRISQKI